MSEFIIPEEMDSDLAEFDVKHSQILFDVVGKSFYLSQADINGKEAIGPGDVYESMISMGPAQAEALYYALAKHLGIKTGIQ